MMVMTAKVDLKKIIMILSAIVALIVGLVALLGKDHSSPTAAPSTAQIVSNDDRVKFLSGFGWEVAASPTESSQVRIPAETSQVYERYNALQKSQGYDLTPFAGKTVMRYVYSIKNFPDAQEPVYATVLIYKNQVIGGDITDTAPKGVMQGFRKAAAKEKKSIIPEASHS